MLRTLCSLLVALTLVAGTIPSAWAAAPAVGPVNRLVDFGDNGSDAFSDPAFVEGGFVTDDPEGRYADTEAGYPLGYPVWYQDQSGLRLTLCQGGILPDVNPMCISDPVNPDDPAQAGLRTGGSTVWWSAAAEIDRPLAVIDGFRAELFLGLTGAFDGDTALSDGRQRSYSLTNIRIDTPVAGTYTVIYPYGRQEFHVESVSDAPDSFEIDFIADFGLSNTFDPDHAFVGILLNAIGVNFLTWTDFDRTLLNNPEELRTQEPAMHLDGSPVLDDNGNQVMHTVHYVGNPAIPHPVTGGTYTYEDQPANYFRVIGPPGSNIDVRTDDFYVSGRVFDQNSFRVPPFGAAVVTLTPDAPTPQPLGTTVTFTAKAGGGGGNYEYRFLLTLPDGTLTSARAYSPAAQWLWNADSGAFPAGSYRVTVHARNVGSTAPYQAVAFQDYTRGDAQVSMLALEEEAGPTPLIRTASLESPLTDDAAFVSQTYLDFLNREVDAAGLAFWVDQLATGAITREAYVDQLLLSTEFDQNVAPVVRLYFASFLRAPDFDGLMFWLDAFAAGMTYPQIAELFAASPEFIDLYGALSNEAFVTQVYLNVYQRQPDADGLAYWTGRLDAGDLTRGGMMAAFASAPEYLELSANDVYVSMTYIGLLLRTPDQGGFNYWLSAMDQGVAGQQMIAFFLASVEYFARFGEVPLPSLVTLTPDPTGSATIGDPVVFTAAANGGSGSYEYRFLLQEPGDIAPEMVQEYAADATWEWATAGLVAGNYQVVVQARNAGSTAEVEVSAAQSFTLHDPVSTVVLDLDNGSPATIGATVTFTAAADGGSGSYEYRFLLQEPGDSAPEMVQDYAADATWEWATSGRAAGDYQVVVHARNTGSTAAVEASDTLAYELIHPPLADLVFTTFELPAADSSFSVAVAINVNSLAVGYADVGASIQGARWTRTSATTWTKSTLDPLAGQIYSTAYDVNDAGLAVGESAESGSEAPVAAYWAPGAGAATPLSASGLVGGSTAFAVNAGGLIVGEAVDADGRSMAVYWPNAGAAPVALANLNGGTFSTAYAVGAGGHIVGKAQNGPDGEPRAVVWLPTEGGYAGPILLNAVTDQVTSAAFDVDHTGLIVGEVEFADSSVRGVVWNADGTVADTLEAGTSAQGISSNERIAGYAEALSGSDRATLWSVAPDDTRVLGAVFSQAFGVNARSQFVGVADNHAFVTTP
ncbi:MAG: DUF4214 domain-containing protein [Desulfuromonadales bacterium]|nr:DUF4214 domain-containing protein [Desulfuromonadales bacterium]